jgi:hypothetical protein
MLAVQISVPWSVGPVGTVWLILRLVGCLKVGKLNLSSEGKMGKTIIFVHELYKWVTKVICGIKVIFLAVLHLK